MKRNNLQAKIWKATYGTIPKDEYGRTYDIHHIDGNSNNNCIDNLQAVSIREHYDIHVKQREYGAAILIARRMETPPENISDIVKKQQKNLLDEGKHNFQKTGMVSVVDKNGNNLRVSKYDSRYISGELVPVNRGYVTVVDFTGNVIRVKTTDERYISGKLIPCNKGKVVVKDTNNNIFQVDKTDHRYLSGELVSIWVGKKGNAFGKKWKHKNKRSKVVICPHCNKSGDPSGFVRWHFNKCKHKNEVT